MRSALRAFGPPVLAAAVTLALVLVSYARHVDEIRRFGRFQLPAFDAYVYVAAAEQPQFFTVAPWGYRVLTPWTVHALSRALGLHNVVQGYVVEMVAGFALAGALLFLFLRAVGHRAGRALVAVAIFGLSPPVVESVDSVFMAEPLSVSLELAFLLGVETGASVPVLCLLLTLLAASKEIWVLLLPLVYVAARGSARRRALVTVAAGVPPLVVALALRWWWAPQVVAPRPDLGPDRLLALLALALTLLALGAWLYVPARFVLPFYGANTTRLMIYVLPFLLALDLFAVDLVAPAWTPPAPPTPARRPLAMAAAAAVAAATLFPFPFLDRYRRVPLHDRRDGPAVLAVCRESLRTARRLEGGRAVRFDLETVAPPEERDPRFMTLARWFLRDGWGDRAAHSTGAVAMDGALSTLLLPSLRPRDVAVTLSLDLPVGEPPDLLVNGTPLGRWREGAIVVPAALLFRGDNLLALRGRPGAARLGALSYAPAGEGPR
ncbi:MAG: hypothetical protein DMF78_03720 [Acidobacteria bacterium]|nr:MAG: hypothetical protein DMF78_03720 [Acidobacteriota bacterium]